jgi:hypothetical protein
LKSSRFRVRESREWEEGQGQKGKYGLPRDVSLLSPASHKQTSSETEEKAWGLTGVELRLGWERGAACRMQGDVFTGQHRRKTHVSEGVLE